MLPHVQETIEQLELAIESLREGSIKYAKDRLIAACNQAKQIKEPQPIWEVTLQWTNKASAVSFLHNPDVSDWMRTNPSHISDLKTILPQE